MVARTSVNSLKFSKQRLIMSIATTKKVWQKLETTTQSHDNHTVSIT